MKFIEKRFAYDRYTGDRHVFEVYRKPVGIPFVVLLDGSFLASSENLPGITEEIEDAIKWFGWSFNNPNFA